MSTFKKNLILDIRKLIKSVDFSYGIVRILVLFGTFIYFPVFILEFINGNDEVMPSDMYYLYIGLLLLHFAFKVLRQTLRRTRDIYLEKDAPQCILNQDHEPVETKDERYLAPIKASFWIYRFSGLSKHIFILWCSLAIILPLLFVSVPGVEKPEGFLEIILWIFGSLILGILNNGWLISRLPALAKFTAEVAGAALKDGPSGAAKEVIAQAGDLANNTCETCGQQLPKEGDK